MKNLSRSFVLCVSTLVAAFATGSVLGASAYPDKPIVLVVAASAGGGGDTFARTFAANVQKEKLLPQSIVVENRTGGAGYAEHHSRPLTTGPKRRAKAHRLTDKPTLEGIMSNTPNPASATTWNERYQGEEYLFGTEPNQYLRHHGSLWKSGSRVLCVADGEGRNSVWLARQGMQVDAFDISEVGVNKARNLAKAAGVPVNFNVSDCDSFAWPTATYDGVASIFNQFADPAMRARMFANMVRCLKPGGLVVLLGYTPKQLEYKTGGPPHLSHYYTPELLRAAFAPFETIELREWEAELNEGTRHSGMSALIGFVARKL